VSIDARLTAARRASIARALEASEYPARLASRAGLVAAVNEVKAAIAAAQAIDPTGRSTVLLLGELGRRLLSLDRRLRALWTADRRRVVAQVIALAALGRAAGHPVQPDPRDLVRIAAPDPTAGPEAF
jgi:hypothetical protein